MLDLVKTIIKENAAPISRNLLRAVGGGLVALGAVAGVEVIPSFVDSPVIQSHVTELVGAALYGLADTLWAVARKKGWAT